MKETLRAKLSFGDILRPADLRNVSSNSDEVLSSFMLIYSLQSTLSVANAHVLSITYALVF
ncbi:hypothetical protein IIB51_01675 [Patescibacteria group bacterium]|nr:hypothetical protein [Patescibacteria group bacterium]MCH8888898.1 hypothetical protein [Patescibacteria group bacterium]